ncbi:MAG: bifunctional oligoribonuclease/PAP phosphatase NrnA [Holophaga sp.]
MLDGFARLLEQPHRVLLTSHENPDGDGTGAMLGLAHYLRFRGKDVRIVVSPELPAFLGFLDTEHWIEAFDPLRHQELADWPEAWILVDASEPKRLGVMHGAFQASKAMKVCLDHHMKSEPLGFDHEFTDGTASASAELVFDLVARRMPRPLPRPMATALYAGLVDDTGSFRFSNASAKVHRMAADLIEEGVLPARVYQDLYHQGRPERLKLFGRAFESLEFHADGRYACLSLTQADLHACGATHDDMEGLVNKPLELKGVEVACLIHELPQGGFKASLRSRERVDVNAVCRHFGGGGHRLASGAKLSGAMPQVQTELKAVILAQLEKDLSQP